MRDRLYERAEALAASLAALGDDLRAAVDDVNAGAGADGPPATPLAKAVRILNNQLQALTMVDERTDALAARLDALGAANGV